MGPTSADEQWLSQEQPEGIIRCLRMLGWLDASDEAVEITKAGEGNMNLTLRVKSGPRSAVLKQARPWVEKYPQILAPDERILFEHRFYESAAQIPGVSEFMPELLAFDADARVMLLTDLPGAEDMTGLYGNDGATNAEVETLAEVLRALHDGSESAPQPDFRNRKMRELNHEHIFRFPLNPENGLELEGFEPGLEETARQLQADGEYVSEVTRAGERYLSDGRYLLHGDYYPGSWLRTALGLKVIDPEFCFYGDAAFDVGVAVAHFVLARDPHAARAFLEAYESSGSKSDHLDREWIARFACIEIMRRLIGVAQLPIPVGEGWRSELLDHARQGLLERSLEPICA